MEKNLKDVLQQAIYTKTGGRYDNPEIARVCAEEAHKYFIQMLTKGDMSEVNKIVQLIKELNEIINTFRGLEIYFTIIDERNEKKMRRIPEHIIKKTESAVMKVINDEITNLENLMLGSGMIDKISIE